MSTYITDLLHNKSIKSSSSKASEWACFELDCMPWGEQLDLISITETETHYFAVAIYPDGKPKSFCCSKKLWELWCVIQETKLKITKLEEEANKTKQKIEALVMPIDCLLHGLNYHLEAHALEKEIEMKQRELDSLYEKFDTLRKDEKCL